MSSTSIPAPPRQVKPSSWLPRLLDATLKFRERSRALLFTAGWARQALELAEELGL